MLMGCYTPHVEPVPSNGREFVLDNDEKKLWDTADYIEIKITQQTMPFDGQVSVEMYLIGIIRRLAPGFLAAQDDRIRVHVLINDTPTAFVLPNGATYLTSGLLVALENEAQLATILGHEISHFINRHALQQHSEEESVWRGGILVSLFLSPVAADLWKRISVTGYSRELESEADRSGLIAILKAGYQPNAAVRAFEILLAASNDPKEKQYSFFASHPRLSERIASYREYLALPEFRYYKSGEELGEERYNNAVLPLLLEDAKFRIEQSKTEKIRPLIRRYRQMRPNDSQAVFLLGEASKRESKHPGDDAMMKAIAHYQEALILDSTYAECYKELGLIYRAMNQTIDSQKMFSRYLNLVPDAPDAPIIQLFME